jgi:four helix bundle protein
MAESKLAALSMDFAVKVLRLCDSIKGHYSLVNQLERSGTSIGANIRDSKNTTVQMNTFLWN